MQCAMETFVKTQSESRFGDRVSINWYQLRLARAVVRFLEYLASNDGELPSATNLARNSAVYYVQYLQGDHFRNDDNAFLYETWFDGTVCIEALFDALVQCPSIDYVEAIEKYCFDAYESEDGGCSLMLKDSKVYEEWVKEVVAKEEEGN